MVQPSRPAAAVRVFVPDGGGLEPLRQILGLAPRERARRGRGPDAPRTAGRRRRGGASPYGPHGARTPTRSPCRRPACCRSVRLARLSTSRTRCSAQSARPIPAGAPRPHGGIGCTGPAPSCQLRWLLPLMTVTAGSALLLTVGVPMMEQMPLSAEVIRSLRPVRYPRAHPRSNGSCGGSSGSRSTN